MDLNIIQGQSILGNTGDVFSGVLNIAITAYTDKGIYICKMSATNTSATPTLNINTIGAHTMVNKDGSALSIGDLVINGWYMFMYDLSTTKFIVLNK